MLFRHAIHAAGTFAPIRTGLSQNWNKITSPIGTAINKVGTALTQNRFVQNKTVQKIAKSKITKAGLHTAAFSTGALGFLIAGVVASRPIKKTSETTKYVLLSTGTTLATIGLGNWAPKNRYLNSMVAGAALCGGFFGSGFIGCLLTIGDREKRDNGLLVLNYFYASAIALLSTKHRLAADIGIALLSVFIINS